LKEEDVFFDTKHYSNAVKEYKARLEWRGVVYASALHYVKEARYIIGIDESKIQGKLGENIDIRLLESKLEEELRATALKLPKRERQSLLETIKR
ncbi:MAG: hypothetical protein ABSD68_03660, partial [Candidatus Micrarchaeales archaeon]